MDEQNDEQQQPESRRDMLMAGLEASEAGTLEKVADAPAVTEEEAAGRARDEQGRFAAKQAEQAATQAAPVVEQAPAAPTLTTWKKEFMPIKEKLAQGLPLTSE